MAYRTSISSRAGMPTAARCTCVLRVLGPLAALFLAIASPLVAQQGATATIRGSTVDATDGRPLPAVQVAVRAESDSVARTGSLTDATGRFFIPGLEPGSYEVRFTRVGYAPEIRSVMIGGAGASAGDLGTVELTPSAVVLDAIDVVAERPAVVHAADRDVYAAESIAGAAGGSATDLLQGVPDLEVDIDGSVRMHGESPAIYINGREAPMTGESLALFLEQFAAANIDRIEVIANPSARYDAEGAGGIVNIVLKEDVGLGISGNAFVSGGTRGELRGGGRATYQRGPLTLNGGASLGLSSREQTSTELRQNLLADPITFLEQNGRSDRSSWSGNLDLGATYALAESTELNAEARVGRDISAMESVTRYTEMDAERNVTDLYDLILNDDGSGSSVDLALELEHEFGGDDAEDAGPRERWSRGGSDQLDIEIEYERGRDFEEGLVERRLLEELGEVDYASELTWEEDRETESELALGFDFARSLGEATEVEIGYEGEFGWTDEGRLQEVRADPAGDPVSSVSGGFLHRQTVHGGYVTLGRTFGDFGAQLGVRAEHADSRLELPGEEDVDAAAHLSLFPSANLNYSFGEGKRVRLSYSMRVRRPSSSVLNPINTSSDPLNRRIGNPDIEPQYTHSYMLNASWSGDLGYLRASPFFRRSVNEWEQIRTVDADGVSTTTYENLGSTNRYGMSITASIRDVAGIRGRVSLNGEHIQRDYAAALDRTTPSSTRWSVRTNLDGEIGRGLSTQGSLVYNPPRLLPQGRASATVMTRVGLRYRFMDRQASVNLDVTDPFDLYDSSIERSSNAFIETGRERVSMRRLTLSLSYSFAGAGSGGEGGGRGERRRR